MLGANKNQSIHEVLTNLRHLDKHKPYGGLSMVFAGDLKQLGKRDRKRLFFIHLFRASKRPLHIQACIHTWSIKSSRHFLGFIPEFPFDRKSKVSRGHLFLSSL